MNMNALKPSGKVPALEIEEEKEVDKIQKSPDDVGVVAKLFGGSKRKAMKVEEKELRKKVKASCLVIENDFEVVPGKGVRSLSQRSCMCVRGRTSQNSAPATRANSFRTLGV